jgi:apolipoprotein N-acyltransferase
LTRPESDTVKIASIILLPEKGRAVDPVGLFSKVPSPFEETLFYIERLTKKASLHHAKIVTFQETAIKIREDDEAKLMRRLQEIAQEQDVYFSVSYGVFPERGKGWNKHVLMNNQGEMEIEYRKRYLLGLGDLFGETLLYKKGPEVIQTTDTPYGRVAISICRDMSFPQYIRQAGKNNVDIMLSPSYDFPKSTSHLYALRAIENGFSFIRPTYNGISFAVDYTGKILAEMDSDNTEHGIMYAEVSTKGVTTLYSRIGDLLGWLCVTGFVAVVVISILGGQHKRQNQLQ